MILGERTITVTRESVSGSYQGGVYVRGTPDTFTIQGSAQPLSPKEIEFLPIGARTKAKWTLYVAAGQPELKLTDLVNQTAGDLVEWNGQQYGVIRAGDWQGHINGVPHSVYYLVEVGADE